MNVLLKILSGFLFLVFLSSCAKKIASKENSALLYGQSINGVKVLSKSEMELLLPQKPNRKILKLPLTPWLYFYRIGSYFFEPQVFENQIDKVKNDFIQKKIDSSSTNFQKLLAKRDKKIAKLKNKIQEGNNFMRVFGEKPSFISLVEIDANVKKLEGYAKDHGFFEAKVSYKLDSIFLGKQVAVVYNVTENRPFLLAADSVYSTNPKILELLNAYQSKSLLKIGERHLRSNFENEKIRIEQLLLNNGFYGFDRDYVKFQADKNYKAMASEENGSVKFLTKINNLAKGKEHQQFKIAKVEFVIDGEVENPSEVFKNQEYKNIKYIERGRFYNKNILSTKILLTPGDYYNDDLKNETQRQLASLDQFQFAQISFIQDTAQKTVAARIYSVPLKKYTFSGEGGLNVFQGLPGPFGTTTLKIRSIFGGLESLELNARAGIEGQTGFFLQDDNIYSAKEFSLNGSFVFPQFVFPRVISKRFDRLNPRTQIGLGINFTDRPEYQRTNFKLAMGYNWQKSQQKTYSFSLLDMNIIRTGIKLDTFFVYLNNLKRLRGNNLIESFRKSFVSSVSYSFNYSDNSLRENRIAKSWRFFAESGGTTLNLLANEKFKVISDIFTNQNDSLNFYKFFKLSTDFRYFVPLGLKAKLAFRFNAGVVQSYGQNEELPYEKYFFVGGSNSLRAWLPRRVGQGGSNGGIETNQDQRVDYTFEKNGNIMLETSLEWRFPIIHLGGDINGAFFIDAGNVWLTKTYDTPESQFRISDFVSQLAIGTGFGLRYDFTFFVLRTDFGIKVSEPARPIGQRFVLDKFNFKSNSTNPLVFNLGIGYPF